MKRILLLILFWLASLYPPVELTRYILAYENLYGFKPGFQFEILFIWIGYVIMMTLFGLILYTNWEDK